MTSPCSVSLSRPSTDPGAPPTIARLAGPPPRPIAPPRPWNSVSSTPCAPGCLDQRGLRLVQHPGRGEEPGLLVRVRVAEHHLLPVATRLDVAAVHRVAEERVEDVAGGGQGVGRLEQRDDIDGRFRLPSATSQLEDVHDIARGDRERHDHAMDGVDPEPPLGLADRPEGGQHLPGRHARRDLGRLASGVEHGLMHGGMLADLERRQVEPECRQLPAQFGHLAPRDPRQPLVRERLLDLAQLRIQVIGGVVVARAGTRFPGQHRPRATQSLGDEPEALAVRLVRETPPELPIGLGQVLGVARKTRGKRPGKVLMRGRRRHRLHESQRHGLVPVEHVVGLDPQRPQRHVRGHARIAVAIAADPGPEPDERRHPWR